MYREHLPSAALAPHVDRFWSSDAGVATATRRILPDGCIDILLELDHDHITARVVGTMTRALLVPAAPQPRVVAVRFRPGAAPRFLRLDASELTDREVDLTALGLAVSIDPRAPLRSLERWLLSRLESIRHGVTHHRVADYAITRLLHAAPTLPDLARETGWSRQWLTRECRRRVGVAPKQLARVARLQRAIIHLQDLATHPRVPTHGLASVAPALGYFDQAHMAKDFRELAHCTSSEAVSIFPIRSVFAAP